MILPADVLTFAVPIIGSYPSVNHTHSDDRRGGRKSPEYLALKRSVRAAAHIEMKRIGWTKAASWYVDVELVRIVTDRRRRDSGNLGKAELDALQPAEPRDPDYNPLDPFPGVYLDDKFAVLDPKIELDHHGIDRVIITARRMFPPPYEFEPENIPLDGETRPRLIVSRKPSQAAPPRRSSAAKGDTLPDTAIPIGAALLDGKPISESAARALLSRSRTRIRR